MNSMLADLQKALAGHVGRLLTCPASGFHQTTSDFPTLALSAANGEGLVRSPWATYVREDTKRGMAQFISLFPDDDKTNCLRAAWVTAPIADVAEGVFSTARAAWGRTRLCHPEAFQLK